MIEPAVPILAVIVTITGCVVVANFAKALAHRLKGQDQPQVDQRVVEELEDLRAQVTRLQGQVDEVLERQDFSERMLAQVRRERLPGATDVAG